VQEQQQKDKKNKKKQKKQLKKQLKKQQGVVAAGLRMARQTPDEAPAAGGGKDGNFAGQHCAPVSR
jgi:hypothetical protein